MEIGQADVAGGALNDLIEVGWDLALDGATINVSVPTSGSFGPGIYRVFNYGGDLLNDNLGLGALPGGSDVSVQTSRSEEHTSELQSLMRISYAVFCLKKKKRYTQRPLNTYETTYI